MPSLALLLPPERVLDLDAHDRDDALRELVALAASGGSERLEASALLDAVLEREGLASTGFGGGLAMPHVRMPGIRRFELALGRSRAGLPFGAIDGAPVHLLLLVVGPEGERERYMKLMSQVAQFLKTQGPALVESDDLQAAARQALAEH